MSGSKIRIGVLHDFPTADEGRSFEANVRRGMQPVIDSGRLDDEVELVHATALGLPLPGGSAYAVEDAFRSLVNQGVAAILGPAISDNALVVRELADAAHVPTLNYTGSEETRSEYGFQYQIGSLEDEPSFLAANLASRGLKQIAVERDRSYVGRRMGDFFDHAASVAGLSITGRADAEAIISLGMWDTARELADSKPSVPVVANSALIYGHHDREAARVGRMGVSRHGVGSERNVRGARQRWSRCRGAVRHGPLDRRSAGARSCRKRSRRARRSRTGQGHPGREWRTGHAHGIRTL